MTNRGSCIVLLLDNSFVPCCFLGKGAAILGCEFVSCRRGHRYHKLFKLHAQGELIEKTQRSTTTNTHPKKCSDIMVADIDPHVIGITESWANEDIVGAELALTGNVMFRKDRRERRGRGVILYIKESIQVYEITLKSEADSVEAIWCNIVTRNSTLTIGVVYRSRNIGQEEDVKLQKAIREVSKGECVIMGDFNHGHMT